MGNQNNVPEVDEVTLEQPSDEDTAEELKAKLVKTNEMLTEAIKTKQNWRAKALDPASGKTFSELLAESRAVHQKPNPPSAASVPPETDSRIKRLEMAEEKSQFGHAKGLAPEETDHVFGFAQGMGIKPSEALDHPFVKNGLDAMRAAARAGSATPGPSSRSPIVEGKSWNDLNTEEKRKHFPDMVKSISKRR